MSIPIVKGPDMAASLRGLCAALEQAQFPLPDTAIEYDLDPEGAVRQRQRLFAEAAEKGHLVAGAHISFPGIGHVGKAGQGYQWFPIPYINDAIQGSAK